MIGLENFTKFYRTKNGKHYLYKNLNFVFPTGRNIGLLGGNGAGKSTLMRMLGGVEMPNSGRIVSDVRVSWPVGLGGGMQGSLTARDNVKFVCRAFGKSREETREVMEYVRDFADIGDYFEMPVQTYSSGMRGKVNFGLSMAFDFDVYLSDEVSSVGDSRFNKKSKAAFAEKAGKANLIMASHSDAVLKNFCDCAAVIAHGNLTFFEQIDDAIKFYNEVYTS